MQPVAEPIAHKLIRLSKLRVAMICEVSILTVKLIRVEVSQHFINV